MHGAAARDGVDDAPTLLDRSAPPRPQKARRRESYQQAKGRNRERAGAVKDAAKERAEREVAESRAAADAELMKLISLTARDSDALN